MHGPFLAANRYELRSASMLDLIHLAYDVDAERIVGGPAWIEMDRFDIFAKTLNGPTPASRKLMLRALLTERFHLATNETTKPMPAWALSGQARPTQRGGWLRRLLDAALAKRIRHCRLNNPRTETLLG